MWINIVLSNYTLLILPKNTQLLKPQRNDRNFSNFSIMTVLLEKQLVIRFIIERKQEYVPRIPINYHKFKRIENE